MCVLILRGQVQQGTIQDLENEIESNMEDITMLRHDLAHAREMIEASMKNWGI